MSWSWKKKPSHVAQVETPCPISFRSVSIPRSLAEAPVAMMRASASSTAPSMVMRNGRRDRSAADALPPRKSAPNRSACLRMLAIRSGPMSPSGNPGKFSTIVVSVSCPPASWPSTTSGLRFARAAYSAAVSPAGPDPRMMTVRIAVTP
jgi:hypothetical protein